MSGERVETPPARELVAELLYGVNPHGDQEVDLDGRPTGPGYTISWEQLPEYDNDLREQLLGEADRILAVIGYNQAATTITELVSALEELEAANDALCGKRSSATYDSMILGDRCQDELERLDEARRDARTALSNTRGDTK